MTSGALAFRERRLRQVRAAHVLAAAGGLATLIGGGYLIESFSAGALVACVAGLAALAGGVVLARRLARTVRYRIDKPNSTAVLAGKVAALLAVLVGAVVMLSAVDAPSAPRSVIVVVLVGSLAAVVNTHAARWTLFQIDATGMKLGRAGVPWPAVARLDLASAGPGFAEIGVQLVAGQVVSGTPAPGRVLADLPVCTVVPASSVQVERIRWAVREFGDPAVPVVVRDQPRHTPPASPPPGAPETTAPIARATPPVPPADDNASPPPADNTVAPAEPTLVPVHRGTPHPFPHHPAMPPSTGARRHWPVAGAVVLAAVLVAASITAVALTGGDDEPGRAAAETEPGPPPADTEPDAEPTALPKTIIDAATLAGTEDLMARIRGADPCKLHDREFPATFGSVGVEPHQALGLAECRLMAEAGGVRFVFGIQLNEHLSEEERADLVPETIYEQDVFHDTPDTSANRCSYYVPFGDTGFGAEVSVARHVPGAEDQEAWPIACEVAGEYTSQIGARIAELPARSTPAPEPTLVGKDPCLADRASRDLLPDWKLGPVSRFYSSHCRFTMSRGDEEYEFDMAFARDAEQLGDEPATVGGLRGVWFRDVGTCGLSLVHVPESEPDADDAHNISVTVRSRGLAGSQDTCPLAQDVAELIIDGF